MSYGFSNERRNLTSVGLNSIPAAPSSISTSGTLSASISGTKKNPARSTSSSPTFPSNSGQASMIPVGNTFSNNSVNTTARLSATVSANTTLKSALKSSSYESDAVQHLRSTVASSLQTMKGPSPYLIKPAALRFNTNLSANKPQSAKLRTPRGYDKDENSSSLRSSQTAQTQRSPRSIPSRGLPQKSISASQSSADTSSFQDMLFTQREAIYVDMPITPITTSDKNEAVAIPASRMSSGQIDSDEYYDDDHDDRHVLSSKSVDYDELDASVIHKSASMPTGTFRAESLAPVKASKLFERPQSRKLYLGNDSTSDPRPALRTPKSAGTREGSEGNESPYLDDNKMKRIASFNGFVRSPSWMADDIPDQRPPSRQRSAFPIHLADEPHHVGNYDIDDSEYESPRRRVRSATTITNERLRGAGPDAARAVTASSASPSPVIIDDNEESLLKRPPSRQKLAAQHLFDEYRPETTTNHGSNNNNIDYVDVEDDEEVVESLSNLNVRYAATAPSRTVASRGNVPFRTRVSTATSKISHDPIADGFIELQSETGQTFKIEVNYSPTNSSGINNNNIFSNSAKKSLRRVTGGGDRPAMIVGAGDRGKPWEKDTEPSDSSPSDDVEGDSGRGREWNIAKMSNQGSAIKNMKISNVKPTFKSNYFTEDDWNNGGGGGDDDDLLVSSFVC